MSDIVDVEAVEERGVIVVEHGLGTLAPEGTIALATRMATALKDIVERQKLYTVISGKKYPQVEAWMTVARMDNVVAREVSVQRHDDGSFEGDVELVRLSDGAVIGHGSSICGSPDDKPWCNRPEYARRSMAVTRATSRAFRQQYSWIMALAGYEPTPADEMPTSGDVDRETGEIRHPVAQAPAEPKVPWSEGVTTISGKASTTFQLDGEPHETPEGFRLGFAVTAERKYQVEALGQLAQDIHDAIGNVGRNLEGLPVTVTGELWMVPWDKENRPMPPIRRISLTRIETDNWTLPADEPAPTTDPFPEFK